MNATPLQHSSNVFQEKTTALLLVYSVNQSLGDMDKYLSIIKTKTPNPVPPTARAAQDL
ncbi:MAG: hypothetical protein AAF327_13020 [Cyanobacteria bacterium P01_A01_bin.37]